MSEKEFKEDIKSKFKDEMQGVYGEMLRWVGTKSGDIEPLQLLAMEEAENALAEITANWLISGMEKK